MAERAGSRLRSCRSSSGVKRIRSGGSCATRNSSKSRGRAGSPFSRGEEVIAKLRNEGRSGAEWDETLPCHGRACPGHPDPKGCASRTGITGTRSVIAKEEGAHLTRTTLGRRLDLSGLLAKPTRERVGVALKRRASGR